MLRLVAVFDLVTTPDYVTAFGMGPLQAQVRLLLGTFRDDRSIGLVLFGIHLAILRVLIYCSGYMPRVLGMLLVIDRGGWVTNSLEPYLFPHLLLRYIFVYIFRRAIPDALAPEFEDGKYQLDHRPEPEPIFISCESLIQHGSFVRFVFA
jgi:Domain of unknown function (DUF4386)